MSFTLKTLTEGIRDRHVGQQNKRLVEKWSRTGLLRGMEETNRENMATLLENQAAQLLRESNTMSAGEVGGFTNIAFPIVRRVFGGLVANELVSIQPMSLPSGLLFYLDYTYGSDNGPYSQGDSIYGSPAGRDLQGGADAVGGQYDLAGSGFSRVHVLAKNNAGTPAAVLFDDALAGDNDAVSFEVLAAGGFAGGASFDQTTGDKRLSSTDAKDLRMLQHDPQVLDLIADGQHFAALVIDLKASDGATLWGTNADWSSVKDFSIVNAVADDGSADVGGEIDQVPSSLQSGRADLYNLRRLNQLGKYDAVTDVFTADDSVRPGDSGAALLVIVKCASADTDLDGTIGTAPDKLTISHVKADAVGHLDTNQPFGEVEGRPAFESDMAASPSPVIPEIDIKIESIPVTAQTRKLRARWSPELAQDLNAYHSMDAEVELTQILSEQIALEIDREILGDLLAGAKGANFFWSRSPGKFVNKRTGSEIQRTSTLNPGPAFTGTVREWYETLTETVIDVANEIHRKTLRGSANFIVVSPDVATILEASVLYRPSYSLDGDGQVGAPFTMGAEKVGTLSNRFTVYKDPYFPRNKILVGYKGGSYLETGFVYAPYVPLIVTPTIFQPDDFTPRKGVMTRYGKKMVRADFYGTVTCLDMNII
jgi:hypothetical protein